MAVDPNGEIIAVRSNIQDLLVVDINNDAYLYREKFDVRSDRKPELYKTLLYTKRKGSYHHENSIDHCRK